MPSVIPTATENLTAPLNAYFAAQYPLVDNFTLRSNVSAGQSRIYAGTMQRNATIVTNASNHWSIASGATTVNVWQVEANAVGPYGLMLGSPYVLVSVAKTVITSGVQ